VSGLNNIAVEVKKTGEIMVRRFLTRVGIVLCLGLLGASVRGQPFQLPTANGALFEPGGEERYFVGTVGKPWTSGTFGGVRSEGGQPA